MSEYIVIYVCNEMHPHITLLHYINARGSVHKIVWDPDLPHWQDPKPALREPGALPLSTWALPLALWALPALHKLRQPCVSPSPAWVPALHESWCGKPHPTSSSSSWARGRDQEVLQHLLVTSCLVVPY